MAKQIKVNGAKSDWYKEAVFVLKEESANAKRPVNLVEYADQVLERHMKLGGMQQEKPYAKKPSQTNNDWIDAFLWMSIGLFVLVCILYFVM